MKRERIWLVHQKSDDIVGGLGAILADAFRYLVMLAIVAAIIWSGVFAFQKIVTKGHVELRDILLLFIYLELIAMISIHFKTKRIPVRFLIYVAITALTRLLISDVQASHSSNLGIIFVSAGIVLLALAAFIVRYGSYKFPLDSPAHGDKSFDDT